jgi:hypothetical protein
MTARCGAAASALLERRGRKATRALILELPGAAARAVRALRLYCLNGGPAASRSPRSVNSSGRTARTALEGWKIFGGRCRIPISIAVVDVIQPRLAQVADEE